MPQKQYFLSLIICIVLLAGCSKNNPVAPTSQPEQGKLMFALDAADNIASGTVTITKGSLTHALPITISNHTGSVVFDGIQVGTWAITVQLLDANGVEIYSGTGEAVVTKNQTTTVTIQVEHNTGNLQIVVETPSNGTTYRITYTADSILYLLTIGGGDPQSIQTLSTSGQYDANNYRGGGILVYQCLLGVCEVGVDGLNNRQIFAASYPRWSWDGSKIAAGVYGFPNHIIVMGPQGENVVSLAADNTDGHDEYPCWTADNQIVYRRYFTASQTAAIMIMNADGSNRKVVKQFSTPYVFPTDCSADGRILFDSSMEDHQYHVYIMNLDGSGMTNLTAGTSYAARNAKFSGDGLKIVFDTYTQIYMMNSDGSEKAFITNGTHPYFVY